MACVFPNRLVEVIVKIDPEFSLPNGTLGKETFILSLTKIYTKGEIDISNRVPGAWWS